jgi:hypothetical protein
VGPQDECRVGLDDKRLIRIDQGDHHEVQNEQEKQVQDKFPGAVDKVPDAQKKSQNKRMFGGHEGFQ